MPESKFTVKEYERRIRDILNKHRMPQDIKADYRELVGQTKLPQDMETDYREFLEQTKLPQLAQGEGEIVGQ